MTTLLAAGEKAETLVEAIPYIREYRGTTVVVKMGGEALLDKSTALGVAQDIALMAFVGIKLIVVHGGGPQVSAAMEESGLSPTFVEGLRVTSDDAMEVVRRVLVGSINPDLVGHLTSAGLAAVGLSGADANVIHAELAFAEDGRPLGRVGRISGIEPGLFLSLLESGYTPVIASVAAGDDGRPLNVNADEVAGAIAAGMKATKLVFLTNVEGLYADLGDSGSLLSEISAQDLQSMIPSLSDGMRPKASAALSALDAGVSKVHILDGRVPHALLLEVFTDEGVGTQVIAR